MEIGVVIVNILDEIEMHEDVVRKFKKECVGDLKEIAELCAGCLNSGHKILLCGNGGSAADSQHIAAEFVGRFIKERKSLPAIALTTDTSILTAVGNDYGYEEVFRRQVESLGNPGDILVGISTSGNSKNIIKAFREAKQKGMKVVAFTGEKSSEAEKLADITLKVPSTMTARIQECHIMAGHIICNFVDQQY
jgi:D-sedoheptulose 7-phosphate isomerase